MRRHVDDLRDLAAVRHLVQAHFAACDGLLEKVGETSEVVEELKRAGMNGRATLSEMEGSVLLYDSNGHAVLRENEGQNET